MTDAMDVVGDDPFEAMGTIGIEEEYFVVDEDGRPVSATDELCYEHDPPGILNGRLDHELFKFVIEAQTPKIDSLSDAPSVLAKLRRTLIDYANDHGYQIAAAGLHPLARWRELDHATKPRYQRQLDRIQYPQHRNTTAGLHIHVGVDDGAKAMWIVNEIRWYLPLMLALSANSPFWNGFDTGLASARASLFEALPTTGMPKFMPDLETFQELETVLLDTDSIKDRGEVWFDVRPHTEYGTIEVRTPDSHHDEFVVMAFVEYVAKLVEALGEGYDELIAGTPEEEVYHTVHADWARPPASSNPVAERFELLDENKWRALRYGHDASFISRDLSGQVSLLEAVDHEIERLNLDRVGRLIEEPSGAKQQRTTLATEGISALCDSLLLSRP